jgi:hypothetical protein
MTRDECFERLAAEQGALVSSGSCSEIEIADAMVRGDFYVDEGGFGFVLRFKTWRERAEAAVSQMVNR